MVRALRHSPRVAVLALAAAVAAPVGGRDDPPGPAGVAGGASPPTLAAEGKAIDLVICLDVSGSMNGLIDSAKIRLWDIVNELARLKPIPTLRVGLYSYGATAYPADKGWVRKELDLTEDLDDVYKALNALRTGGGEEYVARVCKAALDDQKWSPGENALKVIFVCGNEAVDQDKQVPLAAVAEQAKKAGVVINAIYCGPNADPIAPGWVKFAGQCGGRYMNIDMNRAAAQVAIKTEFDDEILKLGEELNKTYVAYGAEGKDKAANQLAQDANAANATRPLAAGGKGGFGAAAPQTAALARAQFKANELYRNPGWDLVDKMKEKDFDIAKIKDEDLPDELKKLKPEERLDYLKKKAAERAELQKKINDLSAKRQKQVDEERAGRPRSDAEKALDEAVKAVVREQAAAKGFTVPAERK